MREWVVSLVGEGMAPFVTTIVAAAIVVLLLLVVIWVARKALGGTMGPRGKGRGPRLAVMDVTVVDQKRKLVLVRRDEVEHLLLIGGQNDVVVEAGILRVPAASRAQRTEPTLQGEPDPIAAPRPAAVAAARLADMQPQGQPSRAPARPAQPRATDSRVASPLTRAVPRPPVAAPAVDIERELDEPTAVAAPPIMSPVAESAPAVEPAETPRTRREPDFAAAFSGSMAGPEADGGSRSFFPGQDERAGTPVDTAIPERSAAAPTPAMSAFPRAETQEDDDAKVSGDLPLAGPSRRPSDADVVLPNENRSSPPASMPQRADAVRSESRGAGPGMARPPVNPSVLPVSRGPAATVRVEPTGLETGAKAEQPSVQRPPVVAGPDASRRSGPSIASPAMRSMATPTYPQRPAPGFATPTADAEEGSAETNRDEPAAADDRQARTPEAEAPEIKSPEENKPETAEQPLPDFFSRPSQPVRSAPSSIVAAAERQRGTILGTPSSPRYGDESPAPVERSPEEDKPEAVAIAKTDGDPAAIDGSKDNAPQLPRPLSVRSFATTIQSMKPSYEPPAPTAAPAPRSEPRPLPEISLPPAKVTLPAAAPWMTPAKPPVPAAPAVVLDDTSSLEDFLSAELDSDFGNVRWNDEPEIAPPLRETVSPAVSPAVSAAPPSVTAEPKTLTLEEEMERLLGDFDFEISDRKAK